MDKWLLKVFDLLSRSLWRLKTKLDSRFWPNQLTFSKNENLFSDLSDFFVESPPSALVFTAMEPLTWFAPWETDLIFVRAPFIALPEFEKLFNFLNFCKIFEHCPFERDFDFLKTRSSGGGVASLVVFSSFSTDSTGASSSELVKIIAFSVSFEGLRNLFSKFGP